MQCGLVFAVTLRSTEREVLKRGGVIRKTDPESLFGSQPECKQITQGDEFGVIPSEESL